MNVVIVDGIYLELYASSCFPEYHISVTSLGKNHQCKNVISSKTRNKRYFYNFIFSSKTHNFSYKHFIKYVKIHEIFEPSFPNQPFFLLKYIQYLESAKIWKFDSFKVQLRPFIFSKCGKSNYFSSYRANFNEVHPVWCVILPNLPLGLHGS